MMRVVLVFRLQLVQRVREVERGGERVLLRVRGLGVVLCVVFGCVRCWFRHVEEKRARKSREDRLLLHY
jgi:hypothetical protein